MVVLRVSFIVHLYYVIALEKIDNSVYFIFNQSLSLPHTITSTHIHEMNDLNMLTAYLSLCAYLTLPCATHFAIKCNFIA